MIYIFDASIDCFFMWWVPSERVKEKWLEEIIVWSVCSLAVLWLLHQFIIIYRLSIKNSSHMRCLLFVPPLDSV